MRSTPKLKSVPTILHNRYRTASAPTSSARVNPDPFREGRSARSDLFQRGIVS
jgi:hypothetical protein